MSSRFFSTYVIQSIANRNWFWRAIGPSKRMTASTQGAYFAFTQKLGIGAVLAAAVGDAIVDDDDLAMVAQIDTADERPQQRIAYRQADRHAHARAAHRLPMLGADERARAEVIDHGPTGHATGAARFSASTILRPLPSGSQM